MSRALILFVLLGFISGIVTAGEKAVVCAKYRANYGWSKGYQVEATILSGSELNSATQSFDYNSISTYVVIFWDQDQVTIIEMSFPYLSVVGTSGEDRQGKEWEVSKGSGICF